MIRDPDYWVDASGKLRSIRKDNLAARVETFMNDCHDEQGRFCTGEQGDISDKSGGGPKRRPREPIISGDLAHIPLSDDPEGLKTTVNKGDLPLVGQYRWFNEKGYAVTKIGGKKINMQQILTGEDDQDHINRDKLDNRRENLRPATRSQQAANVGIKSTNTSGYKGVSLTPRGKWRAQIVVNGETRHLGNHDTPEEAAKTYNRAAKAANGDFAFQNKIKKEGEIHFEE